jgi:hypothetical protein
VLLLIDIHVSGMATFPSHLACCVPLLTFRPVLPPSAPDIEKNRGLTPHRRKDIKNPRKKNRMKFDAATVRRKGQVQEVRAAGGAYGGEATGIKSRLTKSVKL